jgi:hypothetical protein
MAIDQVLEPDSSDAQDGFSNVGWRKSVGWGEKPSKMVVEPSTWINMVV